MDGAAVKWHRLDPDDVKTMRLRQVGQTGHREDPAMFVIERVEARVRQETADVRHLLDSEAGGAIAAFKRLIHKPETDPLNPILVTGSSVLVDDDLASTFDQAAAALFEDGRKNSRKDEADEDELYEQIGRLKMELEWLKKKAASFD